MPEYLSPGVYVEEVDAGPKPIEGVSTSTVGAVGVTVRGPTSGKPVLVTSFPEFVRTFGGYLPQPPPGIVNNWTGPNEEGGMWWRFAQSVQGFFNNGGRRLYVKRAFSADAVASSATAGIGLVSELARDAAPAVAPNPQTISLRHLIDIDVGTVIGLVRGDTGVAIASAGPSAPNFAVTAYDATTRVVTLDAALPEALQADRDFAQIHARSADPPPAADSTLQFQAKARGAWGNSVEIRSRPMVGANFTLLPDAGEGDRVVTRVAANANAGDANVTVDPDLNLAGTTRVRINGQVYQVVAAAGALPPDPWTLTFDAATPLAVPLAAGVRVEKVRAVNPGGATNQVNVQGAARLYAGAICELDNGTQKDTAIVQTVTGDRVTFVANIANTYLEGDLLRVIEAEVAARYTAAADTVEEIFGYLRLVSDGTPSSLIDHINARSELIEVSDAGNYTDNNLARFPTPPSGGWQSLGGGNDSNGTLTVDDFVGVDGGSGSRTGIQAFQDIDEISIALVPQMWSRTVHNGLIGHCEILRDRFAILDPRDDLSIEQIRAFRERYDTKYAALYYPWIEVRDPSLGRNVTVGPSAHMAGIYARVDRDRGVHKAPANEVIRGITRIAQDVTQFEQDMLNPNNINALRFFPGRGNRVWGARVITSDAAWKYINVRRLFLFVEESIDEGTQWVVFEPNDESTWTRVRQSVRNFLLLVWRSGALQGETEELAFYVKCDRTTMTQADIDAGRLICEVGIAPVKPAEFVIFRIQQKTLNGTD